MQHRFYAKVVTVNNFDNVAALFKALSSASRLALLTEVSAQPRTVSFLVEATGLSQPLVSQHLRTLRSAGLVDVSRQGREAHYSVTDAHVTHIVADAISHVQEELRVASRSSISNGATASKTEIFHGR